MSRKHDSELDRKKKMAKKEAEIKRVMRKVRDSQFVQLAILMDCTFSMDPSIESVRKNIASLVNEVQTKRPWSRVEVAFCGYRDYEDTERLLMLPFTSDAHEVAEVLRSVVAQGGIDEAEDVFGGINLALGSLEWTAPTRILFHVGDAPCHGKRFHNMTHAGCDRYLRDGDPAGMTIEDLMKRMAEMDISYWFGRLSADTDKMMDEFKKAAADADHVPIVVPIESANALARAITDSLITTITAKTDEILKPGAAEDSTPVKIKEPNWDMIEEEDARVLEMVPPETLNDVDQDLTENMEKTEWTVQVSRSPFSKGAERYAYLGRRQLTDGDYKDLVFKSFIDSSANGKELMETFLLSMETQAVAACVAAAFNVECKSDYKIEYVTASLVKLSNRSTEVMMMAEKRLPGTFERFSNNAGWVNDQKYYRVLHTFAHYSWDRTDGYLLVADLQGVKLSDVYMLTDPAIHCTDTLRFGRTNLGQSGMELFFQTHDCNSYCKALKLRSFHASKRAKRHSSMSSSSSSITPLAASIRESMSDRDRRSSIPLVSGIAGLVSKYDTFLKSVSPWEKF